MARYNKEIACDTVIIQTENDETENECISDGMI